MTSLQTQEFCHFNVVTFISSWMYTNGRICNFMVLIYVLFADWPVEFQQQHGGQLYTFFILFCDATLMKWVCDFA